MKYPILTFFCLLFMAFPVGARTIETKDLKQIFQFDLPKSAKVVNAVAYDNMFAGTYYLIASIPQSDFEAIMKSQGLSRDAKLLGTWSSALEGPEKEGWKPSLVNDSNTYSLLDSKDGNLRVAKYEKGIMYFKLDVP